MSLVATLDMKFRGIHPESDEETINVQNEDVPQENNNKLPDPQYGSSGMIKEDDDDESCTPYMRISEANVELGQEKDTLSALAPSLVQERILIPGSQVIQIEADKFETYWNAHETGYGLGYNSYNLGLYGF